LKDYISLVALFLPVTLNDNKDEFIWLLNKNEKFSTQSLYRDIMKKECLPGKNEFWKAKLPLKLKVFLWDLKRGVVLTKDKLKMEMERRH